MIRFIKGKFYPQADGTVVIETASGIGFSLTIPANSPLYKHYEGEEVKAYTHMAVREDDMSLYGFSSNDELELFRKLITVSGVGAKAGISIMTIMPVNELKHAIASGDAKTIATANGVGKKTAERVIIDLKDKVGDAEISGTGTTTVAANITSERTEAVTALMALGYSKTEADQAVGTVKDQDLTAEQYIKVALRNM